MRTLILESDPMKARTWVAQYGGAGRVADLARGAAQARLMLLGATYDRFCLALDGQAAAAHALLPVARATNPDCEIVDLASQRSRLATGPLVPAEESRAAP